MKKAHDAKATPADAPLTETETETEPMELICIRSSNKDKDATIAELRMQVEFAKK